LYLRIRLQAARNFLFYEEFSIKDVSNACGFSYPAVFSRAFRAQFGQTPREFRSKLRANQNMTVRPEIRRLLSNPDSGLRIP
jgi:transcriptional regulator GlxA family with amidase domain